MKLAVEVIRSLHFLSIIFGCLILLLWVQEEFESILKRKKMVGLRFLQISFYKKVIENNNLKRETFLKSLISGLRFFLTIIPIMLISFSRELILGGETFNLGLIDYKFSFLLFIFILIINELIRPVVSQNSAMTEKNILLLIIFVSSFLLVDKFYSFKELIEYQNLYTSFGVRKYLIYINPIGVIALFQIIINEMDNPSDGFDIIKVLLINCYLTLFIFSFLGGYSTPTIFNFGKNTIFDGMISTISFFAKYIFVLVTVWVYRFVFVKRKKEIIFNEF